MPIDGGLLIGAFGIVLTIVGGGTAWVIRWGKIEAAAEIAREAKADVESVRKDLSDFKERSAREFATAEMVARVERSVAEGFVQLGNRIDQILMHRQRNSDGN